MDSGAQLRKLAVALLLVLSLPMLSQTRSAAQDTTTAPEISRGTLVVAIASPNFIVVVTDSRNTRFGGTPPVAVACEDNSKKLFRVGKKRVLAIAGLASASISEVPGLTEEIASVLD